MRSGGVRAWRPDGASKDAEGTSRPCPTTPWTYVRTFPRMVAAASGVSALSTTSPSIVTTTRRVALITVAALGLAACGSPDQGPMGADELNDPPATATAAPDDMSTGDHPMHAHGSHDHNDAGHTHRAIETEHDMTVAVEVLADPMAGWNIHITTTGFAWAPERASTSAVDGEGHAHLYLDGEKLGRLYGEWFHLNRDLEPGEHEVRVTLNANNHHDYTIDGEVVEAIVTFTVPS